MKLYRHARIIDRFLSSTLKAELSSNHALRSRGMDQSGKLVETADEQFDLSTLSWDDDTLYDFLKDNVPLDSKEASNISQFLRTKLSELEAPFITLPFMNELIETKLLEYGHAITHPIQLSQSIFVKNGLPFTENARRVLERRYLKKNSANEVIETPAHMFQRVARHIAKAENKYGDSDPAKKMEPVFYKMMTQLKFLPNSPTLMNAGRKLGQLAACFVLPINDSMDEIFDSLKNAALIHKSGGGTGFSFSRLRPKNSKVGTTGGIASGPVSFMKIFNTATEQVKQGGTRRGANMAVLRVDHPDIIEFINSKEDHKELNNFNISIALTDKFVEAVKQEAPYDLIDPMNQKKAGQLNAVDVYQLIVRQAWKNGDPGILFLDRINSDNPTPEIGEIESTNPCGEQPLLPMEACNLGSINLAKFVVDHEKKALIDFDGLKETVWQAVHFLDNTIDMSQYPLPQIDQMAKGNRKIGLGVMGFADMLFQLKIAYNSQKAIETAEKVMRFIQEESHKASKNLAEKKGSFSNFNKSIFRNRNGSKYRNATTTTIAPTGTLSIIANCSSGIEPLFAISFVRNVMDNDKLVEVNPYFENVAKKEGFYSKELMETITRTGSIQEIEEIPQHVRNVFVTAHDVSPEWHINMQAAFQKYTDNAVSKTVNLPRDATETDVAIIYNLAHELGCKGVTIYRDGSKENQVLSFANQDKPGQTGAAIVRHRPETLEGFTTKIVTGLGHLYVTVTEQHGRPFEVFATIGKSGRSTTAKTEAIGRLVSLALRSGVEVDKIIEQLIGIGGEHPVFQDGGLILSIPDAIARVLERRYLTNGTNKGAQHQKSLLSETCPECGEKVSFEEGCMNCHFCGFTKCG